MGVPWCQVVSSDRETGFACWRSGGEDCGRHPDVARMRDGYAAFTKGDFGRTPRRAGRLTGLRGNAAIAGPRLGRGWAGDWLHRSYVGFWTRSR